MSRQRDAAISDALGDSDDGTDGTRNRRSPRKSWAQKSRGERGVVLVWFALMLVVLMGFAGFAVDLSNWWFQAERIQKAADAGAHAGVVFLPADLTQATTTARAEVAKNGYKSSGTGANATIAVSQEPNPNRLRVKVTSKVDNFFVGLLGVDDITLTREAVAEYISPVPMGSPENKLGNDPARAQNTPQFWINIAGPGATKSSGDRFAAKNCGSATPSQPTVASCTGTARPSIPNDDYSVDGYFFALKVTNVVAGQPLQIQAYDPAMVFNGDTCSNSTNTNDNPKPVTWPNAAELNTLKATYGNDATSRYAGGNSTWCTGDQDISGLDAKTTYIVRAPDNTPWSDTDNPVIAGCSTTFPSWNPKRIDASGGSKTIFQLLDPSGGNPDAVVNGVAPWTFAEVYRRNVNLCTIPAGSVVTGEYILQIRTNALAASPTVYTASVANGGHNRFSIQAGFGATGLAAVNGSSVSINARGRLPIYANATGANTTFYLARVLPYDAGRTLRIVLYDMGDASAAGTLQILPPSEFASAFSGCSFARTGTGTMSSNSGSCSLSNVSSDSGYQAQNVTIDIPIPANYTCTSSSATGCWIKVRAAFPSGVSDTTTWSAAILGNPIRLVE